MPVIPPGVPGDAFNQVIGHDLAAGPVIPGRAQGVSVPGERSVDGDTGRDGQQGSQVAHGVRGGTEADVPRRGGLGGALRHGARVAAIGSGTGGGHQCPVACSGQRPRVGREFLIDRAPVRRGQARRFAHQQGGPPLIQLPRLQGSERVRHLRHQALARPNNRLPLAGDSRRASAICAATPAPSWSAGIPASDCCRRCS